MSGISIWQLVIVFLILLLIFGTKKIKSLGGDLGTSIKSFKDAMNEDKKDHKQADSKTIEATDNATSIDSSKNESRA